MCVQAVLTLAVAEATIEFEHRDLHFGNILVRAVPETAAAVPFRLRGREVAVAAEGARVTLIDFTLSRMRHRSGVAECMRLEEAERAWLFEQAEGEGKLQARPTAANAVVLCLRRLLAGPLRARPTPGPAFGRASIRTSQVAQPCETRHPSVCHDGIATSW